MNIITIDFETFYDDKYSLSKLTTEEYLRDSFFEIIGVAVKVNNEEAVWLSGPLPSLKRYLIENYDWVNSAVLAHNTLFDGAILSWMFGIRPALWLDTMSMARALHGVDESAALANLALRYKLGEKGTEVVIAKGKRRLDFTPEDLSRYGDYCINDVELTHKLFSAMVHKFPKKELRVIDMTLRMFTEPMLVLDTVRLYEHLHSIRAMKQNLLLEGGVPRDELMSNPKFAAVLKSMGVEVPMKISARTGKPTFAFAKTDTGLKDLMEHPDPRVQVLVTTRMGVKSTLEETRTERFIGIAERTRYFKALLPIPIRYYAAHTGRWGGSDSVNLQNLPSRGSNAKVLKSCITAPPEHTIIEADSAQIEARIVAWLSGQADLVEAFANKQDVYKLMASRIYKKSVEEVTDEQRFVGKTTVLACGYGMGSAKFQERLKNDGVIMSLEECQYIVGAYRLSNDNIVRLWRNAQNVLMGLYQGYRYEIGKPGVLDVDPEAPGVVMPSGLHIRYPKIKAVQEDKGVQFSYQSRNGATKIYGGKAVENWSQGIARCIMAEQMLLISKRYRVLMTVHDSVVCCVPDEEVDTAAAYVNECMAFTPKWAEGLPVVGEVKIGKNYGELHRWNPPA